MPGYSATKRVVIEINDANDKLVAIVSNHEGQRSNVLYSVSELGFDDVHDLLNKITQKDQTVYGKTKIYAGEVIDESFRSNQQED